MDVMKFGQIPGCCSDVAVRAPCDGAKQVRVKYFNIVRFKKIAEFDRKQGQASG